MMRQLVWTCMTFSFFLFPISLSASDWTHWRGPWQTGVAPDKNLPDKVEGNVIWRQPYGCRSTPLVLNGRVYILNYDSEKKKVAGKVEDIHETIQECVMCLDEKTGKKIWQHNFPVFHTDIVTSRLGWTNMAADPKTGYLYAHGTQGLFMCLDGKDGKVVWQRSMGEEYGRVSGYGGRVTSPLVDEDLAILGMVNSSWGGQAKGANRYYAFNKLTGQVVWVSEPAGVKGTYYSVPVIATIKGQRLLICGGSDGSVFAIQVRTGVPVWRYSNFSLSAINSSPVVDGNYVYIGHGEESDGTSVQGRVVCLDAGDITDGSPKLVWQKDGIHARYASPIIHDGRLYMPDDGSRLYCLDAKTGKQYWKFNYGRGEARGSPVFADGKIYVGEVSAQFHILEPGLKKCKRLDEHFFPGVGGVDVELNGTPAIANGKVYFSTTDEIICIGRKDGQAGKVEAAPAIKVTPGKIAHLQVIPAEAAVHAGQTVSFKVRGFDADGNFVKEVKAQWSLPAPMGPPGSKAKPPALKATITPAGELTVDAKVPNQGSIVVAKFDGLTSVARVRVVPSIPYAIDFEKLPNGVVPGGWVNAQGKWIIKTVKGNKVFAKVNNKFSPLFSGGHAYITSSTAKDYTIEADVMGTEIVGKDDKGNANTHFLPDVGIGANRYTFFFSGNVKKLRLMAWDAIPRIDKTVNFDFKPGVWYRMKLTTEIAGGKGVIKGKAWPRGEKEPGEWTVEVADSRPNTEGSATLYGYVTGNFNDVPGTEVYFDNVRIMPNKAGAKGAPAPAKKVAAHPVSKNRVVMPAPPKATEARSDGSQRRRPILRMLRRILR
ncbi:MAG: PQQ-binding-like beta-propeller repeat protein [Planctomycetes bacterium]|nr:PQQ-binding-like beta-propeller repeat protein [Planctomycetota bacterium]